MFRFQIEAVSTLGSSIFTYSIAATPIVSTASISGSSLNIAGSAFGTNTAAISVVLTSAPSRRRRSVPEEMPEPSAEARGRFLVPDEPSDSDDPEEAPARDTYKPVVHTGLFDDMDADSHFWGTFTKTKAKNFEESKALGAWRIAGSKPAKKTEAPVVEVTRQKREAPQTTFECTPTAVTDTSIVCDSSSLPAGSYDISVSVDGLGAASVDNAVGAIAAVAAVTAISPTEGSVNGGTLLTISGASFTLGDLSVTIDGSECDIQTEDFNAITCLTPAHAVGAASVVVTSGGQATTSATDFTYATAKTPVLTSSS